MTVDEYQSSLRSRGFVETGPGVWSKPRSYCPPHSGPAPELERSPSPEPLAEAPTQETDTERFRVCITSVRERLLDPDNICAKWAIDNCRRAGFIPDDSAKFIDLDIRQRRVGPEESEHTEIVIEKIHV